MMDTMQLQKIADKAVAFEDEHGALETIGATTEADYLHAAQLAAREHVVPHILAAAEVAFAAGDRTTFECYVALAACINGDFDPQILKFGSAFLRFVSGGQR